MARLKAPFTEWPPMATLGRSGDERAGRAVRRGAGRGAAGRRHLARLRAGARRPHQPEEPGHRRPRAGRDAPTTWRGSGARIIDGAAGRRASPPAASTFPGTATRAPTRTSSCRSSSIRPTGCAAVEFVPFRAAIAAGVASIMTAHVLVPSLDEERPATLSPRDRRRAAARGARFRRRGPQRRPRDEGDRATATPLREAAVAAIEAGCDGVLICSGDVRAAGGRRSRR